MRDNTYLRLENVYKKYKGYVETKDLMEAGFSNRQIGVLAQEGYLEKICHGHYWLAEGQYKKPADYKCIEVCLSSPRAAICMDSAMYYHGVLDKEPEYLSVATERTDRSLLRMNFPVKRHYFSAGNFMEGIEKRDTEFGSYYIYNVERSICDVLRFKKDVGMDMIEYVRNNKQQYERVAKYAELLRVRQRKML